MASFWSTSQLDLARTISLSYRSLVFFMSMVLSQTLTACLFLLDVNITGVHRLTSPLIRSATYSWYSFWPMSSIFKICGTYSSGIYARVITYRVFLHQQHMDCRESLWHSMLLTSPLSRLWCFQWHTTIGQTYVKRSCHSPNISALSMPFPDLQSKHPISY